MEMRTGSHFFCENVGGIYLPGDVLNLECLVLNLFAYRIFAELDMSSRLRSHIVGPTDAGVVIIV
jgi:hypothetical protein